MSDTNPTEGDQATRQNNTAVVPSPYPHSTRCPGTDPIAVSIPRAEGSGVRTVNTALARSPELSKVTPPCCKEGGGGGQQHTLTTAENNLESLGLLQSGK